MQGRFCRAATYAAAEEGTTLIELLVSIAIASIVVLALSSIVILGLRFSSKDRYEDQRVYPVRNGFELIVKDLRAAQGVTADCPAGSGNMAVTVWRPTGATTSSLRFVTYVRDTATKRLVRTEYTAGDCSDASPTVTPIASQLTSFDLQYLGDGVFRVQMIATSTDGTEFRMTQRVVGRVLGSASP